MHSKNNGFEHCVANYAGGLELRIAAITDAGKTREGNEDNFAVVVSDYNAENSKALIVVADGMGGYEYGEVASEIVVDTYRTQFMRGGFSLLAAAREADREIQTRNRKLKTRMGSTVVALHLHDRSATFHHAGDSRLYIYANGELEQLTEDHSVVQSLVKAGQITPKEARTHRLKNIITNSIGVEFDEEMSAPETNGLDHPERYLLCSDGLTDMLTDEEIGTILRRQDKGLDEIATELVSAANAKGGLDNITVAVVDVVQRKEVDAQAEDVTVTEGAIKSDPRHPDYTIQRGGLAEVVALFKQGTIRTTTGIQRARFKDASLKDAQLYAANYALYGVEEGEAVLYFGRQENNPILANPEEAVRQFTATGNYVLNPEQAARAKQSALRIKHSELDLQGTEEWQYFSIDTAHLERLNPAQRELAEAVHGLSTQFTGVMDNLKENGINATQIYVLNPEYIKRHAQSGALCRLVWIHTFGNNSSVDLMENRTAEVAMYGVLKPAEEVPAAVLDESISPATPTILETRVSFVDRYIAKIREDAARLKENYALLRTYFTSQEFKDQMQSARTSIEQKVIAVGDGFFETYMPEISRIIESGVARAGEYGLSLLSRERFKKGKAFLRKMALEAVAGISREVVENFTELLDSLQGSSVQDSSQKNSVSVTVEEDNPLYSAKLEEVATKYFASRHGRPYVDETAINAIKRYVEVQGMSRLRRLKPAFDFLRYTRGADALVAPLQEIRAHANLGEIVQQAYTLGDAIERTAVTVLARECGFVDMNEEKAVLAIDYIETAKAQRFSADEAKRQIVFLLETVPSLFAARNITAIREGAANTHAGDFVEGVVAYLQGMQALGRDNAAAEDAFQTVLRRDKKYLRFVGIDMEEVYVGLARVYGEEKDLISLLKTAQKRLAIAPNDSHFKRYQQEYSSLFALAETIESRPHIQSHQQKVINGTASVESYLITLQSILQKGLKIGIDEREREFALFNLFHLQRLGATVAIVDMARLYNDMHCSNTAEFILGKLVEDGSTEQRVYTTLAEIVRAQNTGAAHSLQREEWAKWLDWKAQEVYKGQLERRYQERLQPLQEAIRRNSDDAEPYIQTLQALFEKNESRAPQGEEAEFGRYNLYHAVRLGQTSRLVQWAQSFYDQGHSESAEFILDKIVKDDSRDPQAYTLLAQIVRAQNIGTAHSLQREEWAKWLDWKAKDV